jgi:xanthine dehydrogenase YagS FAD-binding subunit
MRPFTFTESSNSRVATQTVTANPDAVFFAGGTTLIDLMKLDVLQPAELVSINKLPFSQIEVSNEEIIIGANVTNSDLAHHPAIRSRFPALSEALLAGASAQLRNMATTGGNLMQRTRCPYFRDINTNCNKRKPGSGCDAISGFNRSHAILGTSDKCIATHPSDMAVALLMLDARIETMRQDGSSRVIAIDDFHVVPGETPEIETVLERGELITHVRLTDWPIAHNSHYLKVRDRASYEFALASAAVGLEFDGERILQARVALGGVATKPWRARAAEEALAGKQPTRQNFQAAAEAALADAKPYPHNEFKVELAKRTIVFALEALTKRN